MITYFHKKETETKETKAFDTFELFFSVPVILSSKSKIKLLNYSKAVIKKLEQGR